MKKKQNFEEEKTPQRKTSKERNRTEKKKCSKTLGEITTLLLLVDELKRLRNGNENCKKIEKISKSKACYHLSFWSHK